MACSDQSSLSHPGRLRQDSKDPISAAPCGKLSLTAGVAGSRNDMHGFHPVSSAVLCSRNLRSTMSNVNGTLTHLFNVQVACISTCDDPITSLLCTLLHRRRRGDVPKTSSAVKGRSVTVFRCAAPFEVEVKTQPRSIFSRKLKSRNLPINYWLSWTTFNGSPFAVRSTKAKPMAQV